LEQCSFEPTRNAQVFDHIKADYRRYRQSHAGHGFPVGEMRALLSYGFLTTTVYRYGRWCRGIQPRPLSYPFKLLYSLLATVCELVFGIDISTNVSIGPGLYIGHFGGIFLHGDLGRDCSVGQGVTIGYKGAGKSSRPPTIGDNVYIGTSAVIVGDIRIGNNVIVGANTTVVKDVPDGYTVVSAAARMIPPEPAADGSAPRA
jgi:serine O-acetyltransferase